MMACRAGDSCSVSCT